MWGKYLVDLISFLIFAPSLIPIIKMKITFIIKKTVKRYDTESVATIYLRLRDGRRLDSVAPTRLAVNPNLWDEKNECIKSKAVCDSVYRAEINQKLRDLRSFIENEYLLNNELKDNTWLKFALDRYYKPDEYTSDGSKKQSFEELFDEFLEKHHLSEVRKKNFRVIKRSLLRYQLFVSKIKSKGKGYVLDVDKVTNDTLADIWNYFENEHKYYTLYPQIFDTVSEKRIPLPKGKNTILDRFKRIRTFFVWCYDNGKTTNRPFDKFPIEESLYGTPIYISLEEREQIWKADLSSKPKLAIQRDIFIFQSVIGCRVSDLYRLTKDNVVNGAIEYIPRKTKEGRPLTVRVPLNETAKTILDRYKDYEGSTLLPFISEQKYNKAIKEVFKIAGVDRMVTILDPLTREETRRPIYEVASSHMARRTFIGNIYKRVKDPNLVSALSGHKEGSRAFQRYRDIDEDIKMELVKLLD